MSRFSSRASFGLALLAASSLVACGSEPVGTGDGGSPITIGDDAAGDSLSGATDAGTEVGETVDAENDGDSARVDDVPEDAPPAEDSRDEADGVGVDGGSDDAAADDARADSAADAPPSEDTERPDGSEDAPTDDAISPDCGDGVVQEGEECDGDAIPDSFSCGALGFELGETSCRAGCIADTSACRNPECGDGAVEGSETCDGAPPAGDSCEARGFDRGTLRCEACAIDASGCRDIRCGDGLVEGDEACEPGVTLDSDCEALGFGGGTLACSDRCELDTTSCLTITEDDRDGDGVLNDEDNCVAEPNAHQLDFDRDGIGNVCDDALEFETPVLASSSWEDFSVTLALEATGLRRFESRVDLTVEEVELSAFIDDSPTAYFGIDALRFEDFSVTLTGIPFIGSATVTVIGLTLRTVVDDELSVEGTIERHDEGVVSGASGGADVTVDAEIDVEGSAGPDLGGVEGRLHDTFSMVRHAPRRALLRINDEGEVLLDETFEVRLSGVPLDIRVQLIGLTGAAVAGP